VPFAPRGFGTYCSARSLVFLPPFELIYLLSLTLNFGLILVYLLLLPVLSLFLPL
jgi:hypothetical protein